MPSATKAIAQTRNHEDAAFQFAGMLLVSLFPAVFWTLSVAGIGAAIGSVPSIEVLIAFGIAVATFCAATFQALILRQ